VQQVNDPLINPKYELQLKRIGRLKTPVLVLDKVLADIDAVRRDAISKAFSVPEQDYYPGIRAETSEDYSIAILRLLNWLIKNHYELPVGLRMQPQLGEFSLLTTPESELNPLQCLPHIDFPGRYRFAVLHYLNEGDFDGTGFYRHKPTDLEQVTEPRAEEFFGYIQQHVKDPAVNTETYFTDTTNEFELLDTVDYRPDRLLVYPTTQLHSGYIQDVAKNLDSNPATGRLTANFFIGFN